MSLNDMATGNRARTMDFHAGDTEAPGAPF